MSDVILNKLRESSLYDSENNLKMILSGELDRISSKSVVEFMSHDGSSRLAANDGSSGNPFRTSDDVSMKFSKDGSSGDVSMKFSEVHHGKLGNPEKSTALELLDAREQNIKA